MTTESSKKAPWIRIILGSLLVSILASIHINFLLQGKYSGIAFLIILIAMIYISKNKNTQGTLKHLQYKTASILSFLLPVSAMIYSFVFTGLTVQDQASEAAQAGAAIGGAIGGGIVVFFSFIIGLSLGVTFHLMSKSKKS